MTPEFPPNNPRAELEAKLTAYILGELPAHDAAAFRQVIDDDPDLAALYDRLNAAHKLVREAAANPAEAAQEPASPMRLSEARRQKLLAQFKTVRPPEFRPPKQKTSTMSILVAVAAVLVITGMLAGLLLPGLARSKSKSIRFGVANNLKQIELAKTMWADDNNKSPNDTPTASDLAPYLGGSNGGLPRSVEGETYSIGKVGEPSVAELDPNTPMGKRQRRISLNNEVSPSSVFAGEHAAKAAPSTVQNFTKRTSPAPVAAPPPPPPIEGLGAPKPKLTGISETLSAKTTIVLPPVENSGSANTTLNWNTFDGSTQPPVVLGHAPAAGGQPSSGGATGVSGAWKFGSGNGQSAQRAPTDRQQQNFFSSVQSGGGGSGGSSSPRGEIVTKSADNARYRFGYFSRPVDGYNANPSATTSVPAVKSPQLSFDDESDADLAALKGRVSAGVYANPQAMERDYEEMQRKGLIVADPTTGLPAVPPPTDVGADVSAPAQQNTVAGMSFVTSTPSPYVAQNETLTYNPQPQAITQPLLASGGTQPSLNKSDGYNLNAVVVNPDGAFPGARANKAESPRAATASRGSSMLQDASRLPDDGQNYTIRVVDGKLVPVPAPNNNFNFNNGTVPYVTGTYFGGINGQASSQYANVPADKLPRGEVAAESGRAAKVESPRAVAGGRLGGTSGTHNYFEPVNGQAAATYPDVGPNGTITIIDGNPVPTYVSTNSVFEGAPRAGGIGSSPNKEVAVQMRTQPDVGGLADRGILVTNAWHGGALLGPRPTLGADGSVQQFSVNGLSSKPADANADGFTLGGKQITNDTAESVSVVGYVNVPVFAEPLTATNTPNSASPASTQLGDATVSVDAETKRVPIIGDAPNAEGVAEITRRLDRNSSSPAAQPGSGTPPIMSGQKTDLASASAQRTSGFNDRLKALGLKSAGVPKPSEPVVHAGEVDLSGATTDQLLDLYGQLTGRAVISAPNLPSGSVNLKTDTDLTKDQAKQAIESVLAMNGISVVNVGSNAVKAVPVATVGTLAANFSTNYDDGNFYYRQLTQVDGTNSVIPIQYAKASDISAALKTLGADQKKGEQSQPAQAGKSRSPTNVLHYNSLKIDGETQHEDKEKQLTKLNELNDDEKKALQNQLYREKKAELERLKNVREAMALQAAEHSVDITMPPGPTVQIIQSADGKPSQNSGLGQRIGRTFTGKVTETARIKVERDVTDVPGATYSSQVSGVYDPYFVQTESEVIQSEKVLDQVIDELKLDQAWAAQKGSGVPLKRSETRALLRKNLEVASEKNTGLMDIKVKSDKPEEAAKIANTIAEVYQDYRKSQREELIEGGMKSYKVELAEQQKLIAKAEQELSELRKSEKAVDEDVPVVKHSTNAPVPQPEIATAENAFSTFSLNISDVSLKLAAASLEKGQMPDPATIRSEEFINAFDYRDPEPAPGAPLAFAWERAQNPFAHNRDLLRFAVKTAAAGREPGRPLNIVLLLDKSGSMERADRVRIIHEALRVLATQLQPQDKISVVTFARVARLWVDGLSGSQAAEIADGLDKLTPEGGTNLEEALRLAYEAARRHYLANGINRVVLLTDGAANLGNVDPEALKLKAEEHRKEGIALDCFGVGWEGYNDDLLEVLSRNGGGRYGFINTPEEAATDFVGQLAGALNVAAYDVKVQVEFNPKRVTNWRQIGYAKHQLTKEQFRDNTVKAAQIASAESGNGLYAIEVNPNGDGPIATVRVRYRVPGTDDYPEHEWVVPFTVGSLPLEQSSPAMRLMGSASAFSEWLAVSPFAEEVTTDRLLGLMGGVPETYGADERPKKLEWMIRQAKSLQGK